MQREREVRPFAQHRAQQARAVRGGKAVLHFRRPWGVRRDRGGAAILLLAGILASGCVSWRKRGVVVSPPRKLRVVLLPLELDFKVKRPEDLETVLSTTPATAAERRREAEALKARLREQLAADFEARISSSYVFSPIPRAEADRALADLALSTAAATPDRLRRALAEKLGADAVLRIRVHGYGRVKASWLLLLWASSFVEGASQGVVVAEAAGNVWAAAGVAAEEVLQEGLEWLGGGYLFNRFYAPVVVEGDLFSGKTGEKLWGRWLVVTENKEAVRKLPKAEQRKKEVWLFLTFQKARDRLLRKLETAALKREERGGR